jgi:uncharacterized repeat protein (TIGR01451 family)
MSNDSKVTRTSTRWPSTRGRFRFVPLGIRVAFLLAATMAPRLGRAEPVPLRFHTFTVDTNIMNMAGELGPGYTGGLTMDFLAVATCEGTTVDARVTAVVQPGTEFATGATDRTARGYIPNYKATTRGQPNGDLGLLYAAGNGNVAGVALTISFFDGTADQSGTFREACVVPDLQLLVYDVDGEPTQAEWFDAFYADGLYSYATGSATTSVTATPSAAGVRFLGPGKDCGETDACAAVALRYRNARHITLVFGAEQNQAGTNLAFAAIDGDAGLPVMGDFQTPTLAPASRAVPSSAARVYSADSAIHLDRRAPAAVGLNVPFDYTLTVTNVTRIPVHDVVVLERLPKNFQLQSSDPQAERGDESLSWKIGSLDPNASREIKVTGIATTADNVQSCATVTFAPPLVCADITVTEPKLTFTAAAPKEVLVRDPIELQFVVTNDGTGVAEDVRIVATLPAGLRTTDDKAELVFPVGTLAPGQSRRLAGSVKAAQPGEYVTKASAVANAGSKAEAATTTIVRQPVLALAKTGPVRQYIGRPLTYEITIMNKGDAPAANTVVEDTIPPAAQGIETSPTGMVSGSKVVWQLGTLAVNASRKLSVSYAPTEAGALAQAASAAAVCADAVSATAETTVYGIAAVLLEVVDTNDPVQVGGRTTYVITATNQGSIPSTNVQITATVEDAQEIVATSGPTSVAVEGNTARSAPLATLAPKAKATWQITVKALKAGDVRFRATMTTAELGRDVEETEATQLYE